jgi:hypothetical protein
MSPAPENPIEARRELQTPLVANPFVGMAGFVYVLLPHLSPALPIDRAQALLLSSAQLLGPIRQGGFECRLSDDNAQVDLQQCIHNCDEQQKALRTYLGTIGDRSLSWGRLRAFAEVWADRRSSLSSDIEELWIELDNDGASQNPNVFIGLNPRLSGADACATVVEALAHLTTDDTPQNWLKPLRGCFEACPTGARVSHIGMMLGRGTDALRVNVKGVFPASTLSYLHDVGWNGAQQPFIDLHEELAVVAERATLCLDIGTSIKPNVALECTLTSRSRPILWWAALLDVLIEVGLCTPAKKAMLLAWPGSSSTMTCHTGWPADLIVEALWHGSNRFGLIRRSISHVKVSISSGTKLEAKAYLWFNHEWVSAA